MWISSGNWARDFIRAISSGWVRRAAFTPAAPGTGTPASFMRDTREQIRAWAYWT